MMLQLIFQEHFIATFLLANYLYVKPLNQQRAMLEKSMEC